MEENISSTQMDLFHDNRLEALPMKSKEPEAGPLTSTSEWPSLLVSQRMNETSLLASSIPPVQKLPASPARLRKGQSQEVCLVLPRGRNPSYHKLVAEVEPNTLSFIITDLRTRILAGVKKETFEELLKSAGTSSWQLSWPTVMSPWSISGFN